MKNLIPTLLRSVIISAICCLCLSSSAQYVSIPDTAFVSWLQQNGYAACMNGNQLDTTNALVTGAGSINCSGRPIRNLTGIQYFKSLTALSCNGCLLTTLSTLPGRLHYLDCGTNQLRSLPALPNGITQLTCYTNPLVTLPALPDSLQVIWCAGDSLIYLPALPAGLTELRCYSNVLTSLPTLPPNLLWLDCYANPLNHLPVLPSTLTSLLCYENQLDSLPALPPSLQQLWCEDNNLKTLPTLPAALLSLDCSSNALVALPTLPAALGGLNCSFNQLTSMPLLPAELASLGCRNNGISSLPSLPPALQSLDCSYNLLTGLPAIPTALTIMNCDGNNILSLPELPDSMTQLSCNYNANLFCLPQLKIINALSFVSTGVTCLPNYGSVASANPPLNTVPLCGIFNPGGCNPYWDISGIAFYDQNSNCIFDTNETGVNYTKAVLDSAGVTVQQMFTGGQGYYSFQAHYGKYSIGVDTSNIPFAVSCPDSGYLYTTVSAADSFSYNNNFAFKCRTEGFDVGVHSIVYQGPDTRPATIITLHTTAGDITALYGGHCAAGVSGQVQLTYTGPVTYLYPAYDALPPASVSNGTVTWNVDDFGAIDVFTAFNLVFQIDSNAAAHAPVNITVSVTPITGDNNPANNTLSYGFEIIKPHDPNEKEVYPAGKIDTSNHWLTYTIRFQNTGNASAINVRITDTLDSNLDPSTFQLLAYSAKNITQLFGNDVVFNFPNINLADSATSDSASRGYVQYKIKLKDNLSPGVEISNMASIYFDLNNAVVTNTVTDTIGEGATGIVTLNEPETQIALYPNPAHNYTTVYISDKLAGGWLELSDAVGRDILHLPINTNRYQLQTGGLAKGVYLVRMVNNNNVGVVKKLVVQ